MGTKTKLKTVFTTQSFSIKQLKNPIKMVKFMAASLLAASAFANTEVTNKAVTCTGSEMTVTFDTNRDISLANLEAGTCTSGTGITDDNYGSVSSSHSITFDPYACVGQTIDAADISTYSVEVPISF